MPEKDLLLTLETSRTSLLLLGIVRHPTPEESEEMNAMLQRLAANHDVWLGLPPDHPEHSLVPAIRYFDSFEDLDLALTQRAGAATTS